MGRSHDFLGCCVGLLSGGAPFGKLLGLSLLLLAQRKRCSVLRIPGLFRKSAEHVIHSRTS